MNCRMAQLPKKNPRERSLQNAVVLCVPTPHENVLSLGGVRGFLVYFSVILRMQVVHLTEADEPTLEALH